MTSDDDQGAKLVRRIDVSHLNQEQGSGVILKEMMQAAVVSFEKKMPCHLDVDVNLDQLRILSGVPTDVSSAIHGDAWTVVLRVSKSLRLDSETHLMGLLLDVPSEAQATDGESSR